MRIAPVVIGRPAAMQSVWALAVRLSTDTAVRLGDLESKTTLIRYLNRYQNTHQCFDEDVQDDGAVVFGVEVFSHGHLSTSV
jgi:hypothetical protein